jgi:hypothetical protein
LFFIDGTYEIDHIIKIHKTEHYEGMMKRIHNFQGKSRAVVMKTSTRNE